MAFFRRFQFDPYSYARTLAHGPRARAWVWGAGLASMLGSQLLLPCAQVCAQMQLPQMNGLHLGDGRTESTQLGNGPNAPSITKVGSGTTQRLKVKPSAATGCGPGGNCDVTTKPLDLSHTPTEKELRMAGQMGGALSPLFPADVPVWQQKFDADLKKAGVPHGLSQQVAPPEAPQDNMSRAVNQKRAQIERLKKMNLDFGTAMQQWNKHEYRAAAAKLQEYIKTYPESPWAGEAALHLGCDAKYNGRFNEAQTRLEEILNKTSDDPTDPSWEIHQKAKLRWADLDIGLGRLNGASDKIANMLMTEKDWRRKSWERYWFRSVNADKRDSRVLRACGTKALGFVLASVGKKDRADALNRMTPTRQAGFSLAELSQLSVKNGAPMQGFRASVAQLASVPLPFIIHYDFGDAKRAAFKKARGSFWPAAQTTNAAAFPAPAMLRTTPQSLKRRALVDAPFKATEEAGHFLVVNAVDAKTGRVHMFDPQEGRHYTLSFNQMQSEWSGVGLRLASAPNQAGKGESVKILPRLSMLEMKKYVGGCCGIARAPSDLGPSDNNSDDCPEGSPKWSVNPVSLNLNVYDIPLWYNTPVGPDVQLKMSYNSQDSLNQNSTLGNKWSFGYGSYLVEDTGDGGGVVTVFMPLGTEDNYIPGDNNTYKADRSDNLNKLRKIGDHRFILTTLDGTQFVYDIPAEAHSLQPFLVEQRDKFGYALHFGYDGDNRLRTIEDAQGKVTQLFYDGYGHLIRARTPQGREATWDYDVNGNMVQTVDIEGNAFGYVYDSEIRLTDLETVQGSWQFNIQGPDGNPAGGFVYPAPGAPTWEDIKITVKDPNNGIQEFFYDGGGTPFPGTTDASLPKYFHVSPRYYHAYVNANDNNANVDIPKDMWQVEPGANGIGHVTAIAEPTRDGGKSVPISRISYDAITGWPISFTDAQNRTLTLTRNAMGQVTSATDWRGRTSHLEYAPNGLDVTKVIDEQGITKANITYTNPLPGAMGQLSTLNIPSQVSGEPDKNYSISYTPWGTSLSSSSDGDLMAFSYDDHFRLHQITHNGDTVGTITYDDNDRPIVVTDAGGQSVGYAYDELNHLRKVTFPDGTTEENEAVCCGLPGATKDRAGRWTYYDYDALKRPIRIQDPGGNTLSLEYDGAGNIASLTDAKGTVTGFHYDERNELTAKVYADSSVARWAYNDEGDLIAQQNAQNDVTRYSYNSNEQLTKIDYPHLPDITIAYDNKDRPIRVTDAVGTTRLGYDGTDRVVAVDGPWDSDTVTYGYENRQLQNHMHVQGVSGSPVTGGGADDVSFDWDSLGRLQTMTATSGIFSYAYQGNTAKLTTLGLPNGTHADLTYDTLDRLNSIENRQSTGDLISRAAYGYETGSYVNRGTRTFIESQYGEDSPLRSDYDYDVVDRLTHEKISSVTSGPGGETLTTQLESSFGYDAMGNRLSSHSETATHNSTTAYTPNALNQLVSTSTTDADGVTNAALEYDPRGNLTDQTFTRDDTQQGKVSYSYDDLNRLSQIVKYDGAGTPVHRSSFLYDASSRRRVDVESTYVDGAWQTQSERRYVYDGMEMVQERDENNHVVATYTWAGNVGGLMSRTTADGTFYYHYDGAGNVAGMTDSTGAVVAKYRYSAYGRTIEATGSQAASNPFRFATRFCHLQSGLYDYGFRFYDVGLGRWLNRDPIKEAGGVNLYEFVGGDPVNNFDQYGLSLATFFDGFSGALGVSLFTSYVIAASVGIVECAFGELAPIITAIGGVLGVAGLYEVLQQAKAIEASNMCDDDKDRALGEIVGNLIASLVGGAAGSRNAGLLGKCFTAGTPVLMADGSYKAIEQVKPGDEVLSKDEVSGNVAAKKVEGLTVKTAAVTRLFHFNDGSVVEATLDHPFYVEGHGWTVAGEIGIGTSIVTRAGPSVKVTQIETRHQEKGVYNLTVEDYHTYFVTQAGLWVHNVCGEVLEPAGTGRAADYESTIPGASSDVASQKRIVPALSRPKIGRSRSFVKFDGQDGNVMIDRKLSIYGTAKAKGQFFRWDAALSEPTNSPYSIRVEVPTQAQANTAINALNRAGLVNRARITVSVVPE